VNRRTLLSWFPWIAATIAILRAPVVGQKGIIEKGKAVVCESDSTTCPNGHKTYTTINAPLNGGK
jgi:hypothetical protein